ncbi:hypothetical protein MKX03_016620 [Papaver bracteatum]|nr:hypothetical protein MKX03_016620 [Papaver bracteatum]
MGTSCFSFVSFFEKYHIKTFKSCHLSSQCIKIDSETTIHLWKPNAKTNNKPALILIHGFGANSLWQWPTSSDRTEIFQEDCLAKVMECLGVDKYSIIGTSYGGFVGYRMASLWPNRVERIVIASSAVNMRLKDNEDLIKKSGVEKIEDLLIPVRASEMRTLLRFAVHKRLHFLPDFLLNDIINVNLIFVIGKTNNLKGKPIDRPVIYGRNQILTIYVEIDRMMYSQFYHVEL